MKPTKPIKVCLLCKKPIDLTKDSYVRLTDYKDGVFFCEGFYHNKCWTDNLNSTKGLKERAVGLLNVAENVMKRAGFMKQEDKVYEIPLQ